jgi:hypothetical protein
MTRFALGLMVALLSCGYGAHAQTADTRGKVCRMEQQCHWENFKKICTYVKVCRESSSPSPLSSGRAEQVMPAIPVNSRS